LTNQAGQPLSNAQISFFLHQDSEVLSENSTTDSGGFARANFSLSSIGEFVIDAEFSGNIDYYGENSTLTILVSRLDTYLSIQIPPNATKKEPLTVVASLQDENGEPVADAEVDFYFNDGNGWVFLGSYLTDQNGVASKSYVPQNVGLHSFKTMFEETEIYSAASSEASLDVFSTDADYSLILAIVISGIVIFLLYLFLKRRKTSPKASSVEKTPSS
jgi:5-hydroxyisourate hydrolase-like protein (transthyretin family)